MLVDQVLLRKLFQKANLNLRLIEGIQLIEEKEPLAQMVGGFLLKFILADILFKRLPLSTEGQLHETERQLISDETFDQIVQSLGFKIGNSGNVLKTFLGVIYLNARDGMIQKIVQELWSPFLPKVQQMREPLTIMSVMQEARYSRFFEGIKYNPKNLNLFQEAFTRSTAIEEGALPSSTQDYQRLEFFGDRILNFMVIKLLSMQFPKWSIEQLQRTLSLLTANKGVLPKIARELNLTPCVIRGFREATLTDKMHADALEAVIGAVYQDSDDEAVVFNLVKGLYQPYIDLVNELQRLEDCPNDADTLYKKAVIFCIFGNTTQGLEHIDGSLRLQPNQVEVLHYKAGILHLLERYTAALPVCEQALKYCNVQNHLEIKIRLLKLRGDLLECSGRQEEALDSYREASRLRPSDLDFWYHQGRALSLLKRSDEALKYFQDVLSKEPNHVETLKHITLVLGSGKFEERLEYLNRWIQIDPNAADAFRIRGRMLQEVKRYQEALENCKKSLDLDPCNERTHTVLADVYYSLTQYDKALKHEECSLKICPGYVTALIGKGHALCNLKREQEAIESYRDALKQEPKNATALHGMGTALHNCKDYSQALKYYNESLQVDSDNARVWFHRGLVLGDLGRFPEALEDFERSLKIKPRDPIVLSHREVVIDILKRQKEPDKSDVKVATQSVSRHQSIGEKQLFSALGRPGLEHLKQALASNPDMNQQMPGKKGDTPLCWLVRKNRPDMREKVQLLLQHNALWSAPNKEGETAEEIANRKGLRFS